ncbi:SNF2-related protein [[Clostridium] innocuum]|nr:SNF2-related protein [[Clostridium] innocuum]
MARNYKEVHEIWKEQALEISSSPDHWISFLSTASWHYKYSFEDQILIYAQRPDATACAGYEDWNNKMNRYIRRGSKGIALLGDNGYSLRYVFDIVDTGSVMHRPLKLWSIHEQDHVEVIEMLNDKFDTGESHDLGIVLKALAEMIVEDNYQDYVAVLVKYHKGSGLSELDGIEINHEFKILVEYSLAYMLMNRCGIDPMKYLTIDDFSSITLFDTLDVIGQLGVTNCDLSREAFKDISSKAREIMIRTLEENKNIKQNIEKEGSDLNARNHVQSGRRLSDAKYQGDETSAKQPIRKIEAGLSESESAGTPVCIESEQRITPAFEGDIRSGIPENGSLDESDVGENTSSGQRTGHDGMGGLHEQPESERRGNHITGDRLQLDLNLGDVEVKKEPETPPFNMDDLPRLLRGAHKLNHSKEDIVEYFNSHTDDVDRANYIREAYDDTLIMIYRDEDHYDLSYLGYKKIGDKLNVWSGNWQKPITESSLSFHEVQQEIAQLIKAEEYLLSPWDKMTSLQKAYERGHINSDVNRRFFSYHDFLLASAPEILAEFKNQKDLKECGEYLKSIYPDGVYEFEADEIMLGFEKQDDQLLYYMGSYDNQVDSHEYTWELVAQNVDGLILSRYYAPDIQIPTVEEQLNALYENEESFKNGIFFSQEEIDRILTRGNKYRIYQQFLKYESTKENVAFLKNEYGTGGSSPAVGWIDVWHDGKGIRLKRGDIGNADIDILLKWNQVSKRISELIAAGRYLSPAEKEQYPKYLQEQMERQLEYERRQKEKELGIEKTYDAEEPKDTVMVYQWQTGDIVHIGATDYEIIEDGDPIVLQDKEFPLFIENFSKEQLLQLLKENPLNDSLLVGVPVNAEQEIKQQAETITDEYATDPKRKLYEQFSLFADSILQGTTVLLTMETGGSDHPLMISHVDNNDIITMFHCYEVNGLEVNEPMMEFQLNETHRLLNPLSYENQLLGVSFNAKENESNLSNDDVEKALFNYAEKWFHNIIDKKYYMNFEQLYGNAEKTGSIYNLDYNKDKMITITDMPYAILVDYAKEHGMTIAENVRDKREKKVITNVLYKLKINDVRLTWKNHSLVAKDDENVWYGKAFYDFILDEALVYDEQQQPQLIRMEDYEELLSLRESYVVKDNKKVVSTVEVSQGISDAPLINYHIMTDALGVGTPKERYRNNIAAIRLLFSLEKENRKATTEEQEILAQYVGWGGLSEVFDESKGSWADEYVELKALLNEDEYRSARESTLSAFYTSPVVIESIYQVLDNLGFRRGNILEPSCGIGNFLGMLPESMQESKLYGIELDAITGRIAKQLYQKESIAVEGYEDTKLPDSFFDVAIGNIPFGQFKVSDKRYDKLNFNIHDYFFAKTLDKVRPGGIIAFVTSRYTMDKQNGKVREYINERAELLGAIRLPNTAFKDSANTKAVSDILFLQKRDAPIVKQSEWTYTSKDEHGYVMNNYFIEHPEMVLGHVEMTKAMYGREDLTVVPFENIPLQESLQKAISHIYGYIDERTIVPDDLDHENEEIITIPADPTVRNFSYTLVEDDVYYRENSIMTKMELSKTAMNRITGLIDIRNCVRQLIEYEMEDYPDEQINQQQDELNRLYDNFTKSYGLINSRGNSMAFRDDDSYYLLCSLENLNEDGTLKSKADIFYERTIGKKVVIDKAETSNEALLLSLSEKAKVDLDYMSSLTGFDKTKILSDLHGVIYKIPNAAEPDNDDVYVTADEYLSGNIRNKLRIAELSAKLDPQYEQHVEALKQAMPTELSASEIDVRIGATWIPSTDYEAFMNEILSMSFFAKENIHVSYNKIDSSWSISNKTRDRNNIKAEKTYGTHRANAYRLIEDCLNLKSTKIFDYEYDEEGRKKQVLNKKETMIAQQKQDSIKEAFLNWVWKDFDRRERLTKFYNEKFNSIRPRNYNGDHLTFPGMNTEITLRSNQSDAVARGLYGGNSLLAHVVGAGKTYEMIAICMELKRLALAQKSLFVVPNHLVEQWGSDFLRLYPAANVLVVRKQDFEKNKRKKFCSRIATGDYDAIIMGHSTFGKIPMSAQRQKKTLEKQLDTIVEGIQQLKDDDAPRYTVKQLEKTKKNLKKRLEKLNDDARKDDVITFEELGIDHLFVDESHNFKNLFLYTKMRNVAGLSQTDAQKSSDLYMKCQYLNEITGGKGITFATGTPISNSMTEMYTIQRYLQYDLLEEHGLENFDAWASTFGETVSAIELAPEGTGYRMKTRFSRFYNLPELISMFKEIADIKTADMLNLPTPTAHYETIAVKPSEMQKSIVESLAKRAEKVRNGEDPRIDNMLKITNDGRKLALDQRLIDDRLEDFENSKVNICIQKVLSIYKETEEKKSTQLIFCDMSTPHRKSSSVKEQIEAGNELLFTNVYDDIAEKLIRRGVPADEIAYIHDAETDATKKELFAKVRTGSIRILLGSTQKMGAGTNVQDLLIASHDLDCPWRPSDLEQRGGRIVRQGNTNSDVYIYRYVTEQTFDAYLYQLVEGKQKFISQIMTSKSPVRSAEDIDDATLSYAEIKALASGNPKIKEKMDLDIQVSKLKMAKANYLSERYDLEDRIIKYYPKKISLLEENIRGLKNDIATLKPVEDFSGMMINNIRYDEKEHAGNSLILMCKKMESSEQKAIGEYRGFQMLLSYDVFNKAFVLTLKKETAYSIELGDDVYGNLKRIDNLLNSYPDKLKNEEALFEDVKKQLGNAKEEVNRPFEKEEELKEKTKRLSELNKELDISNKNDPSTVFVDDEPDENVESRNEMTR